MRSPLHSESGRSNGRLRTSVFVPNVVTRKLPTADSVVAPQRHARSIEVETQQGVLDDLGERRMDPVLAPGHLAHTEAEAHRLDQRLDQGGRLLAHQMRADELSG